jgi:hypothetical protein
VWRGQGTGNISETYFLFTGDLSMSSKPRILPSQDLKKLISLVLEMSFKTVRNRHYNSRRKGKKK